MDHGPTPALDALEIQSLLVACGCPWRVETLGVTDSTNSRCIERGGAGEPGGLAILADSQTAGRGRRGSQWLAPPGSALLFSVLLRPALPPSEWHRLTLAAAVGLCEAIEESTPLAPAIKWPNDVLVDGSKLCGVLVESQHGGGEGFVVVGVGMNVSARSFPEGLRQPATSLALALGHPPERGALAAAVLGSLHRATERAASDWPGLLQAFERRDALYGRRIAAALPGGPVEGIARGLDPQGALRLECAPDKEMLVLREASLVTQLD